MNWIKGFRREVIEALRRCARTGIAFSCTSPPPGLSHRRSADPLAAPAAGRSKFGFSRIPISLLDVIVIWFLLTFSAAPHALLRRAGAGRVGDQRADLCLPATALACRADANPTALLGRRGLGIAGLLLFLIGFLAELIVTQGEWLGELERVVAGGGGQESGGRSQEAGPSQTRDHEDRRLTHNYPRFRGDFSGRFVEALSEELVAQGHGVTSWHPGIRPIAAAVRSSGRPCVVPLCAAASWHQLGYMRTMRADVALRG